MTKQRIAIIGPIGSFKIGTEQVNGIQLLDVVSKVSALPADTTELEIAMAGPGGRKDVGDNIFLYLQSLKPRLKISSVQVGDIGSILSKIWFAGDERTALKGINPETGKDYEIFIHNPWTRAEGDAAALRQTADEIEPAQEELALFYSKNTGITLEGIKPLMAAETGFNADKAVELKFATKVTTALNIAAYMDKPKNPAERLLAFIDGLEELLKGKGKSQTMALVLELEGAIPKINVEAADAASMKDAAAMLIDANGAVTVTPVPDGPYVVKGTGMKINVKGGKVESVEEKAAAPAAAAPAAPATQAATETALNAALDRLEAFLGKEKKKTAEEQEQERIDKAVQLALDKMKKDTKQMHRPNYKVVEKTTEEVHANESTIQAHRRIQNEKKTKK